MHNNERQAKCARVLFLDDLAERADDGKAQLNYAADWAYNAILDISRLTPSP